MTPLERRGRKPDWWISLVEDCALVWFIVWFMWPWIVCSILDGLSGRATDEKR